MVRVCWGHVLGGYILKMGRRDGAFCTHLEVRRGSSYGPGLRIYYKYEYWHVRTPITSHVRAEKGARHVRAEKGTARTPLHSPLHRAHPDPIAAGTRSPHECDAPANKIRRHSFISTGFASRTDMPPSGNPFLGAQRNKAASYLRWAQGGLRSIQERFRVKATATQVAKGPNMPKWQDGFYPNRTPEREIDRALATANGCIWD